RGARRVASAAGRPGTPLSRRVAHPVAVEPAGRPGGPAPPASGDRTVLPRRRGTGRDVAGGARSSRRRGRVPASLLRRPRRMHRVELVSPRRGAPVDELGLGAAPPTRALDARGSRALPRGLHGRGTGG